MYKYLELSKPSEEKCNSGMWAYSQHEVTNAGQCTVKILSCFIVSLLLYLFSN